jgi:hypothetical protein
VKAPDSGSLLHRSSSGFIVSEKRFIGLLCSSVPIFQPKVRFAVYQWPNKLLVLPRITGRKNYLSNLFACRIDQPIVLPSVSGHSNQLMSHRSEMV